MSINENDRISREAPGIFDARESSLSAEETSRLASIRATVLESEQEKYHWFGNYREWAVAGICVFAVLWGVPWSNVNDFSSQPEAQQHVVIDVELLEHDVDIELLDDYEFYQWMSEEGMDDVATSN